MTTITHTLSHPATDSATAPTDATTDPEQLRRVRKVLARKSFATLATTSPAGRPHVAGVLYVEVDGALWIHTMRTSRKARSIAANRHVAVTVPFRKLPAGPPYTLHFQGTAEIIDMDDPIATDLVRRGRLKKIAGHGALDDPDGVFVRVEPNATVHSYGLGANPIALIRDPLHTGADSVRLDADPTDHTRTEVVR